MKKKFKNNILNIKENEFIKTELKIIKKSFDSTLGGGFTLCFVEF